ncbi:MAG: Trehalose synthase [Methanocella sp. PtaU1.Bin125]|nr:MAG: Trehalose synthase [Methanocella sp. PtaU1.Bin125]
MKIAVFTDTFYPQVNGVVNAVRNYDRMLTGLGHVVTVFTSGKKPGVTTMDGAEVRRYRAFTFLPYPEFEASVDVLHPVTAAVKFRPDVVHAHTPFLMGYCAWMTAMRLGLPLVGTFHTPIDEYVMYIAKNSRLSQRMLKRIAKYYQDWFYNRCDVVIVPAPSAARYLQVKGRPIIPVSNGIDLSRYGQAGRDEFRAKHGLGDAPVIMHGGRLSFEKRIEGVIDAMPRVLERVPGAKLMIVGRGPAKAFLEGRVRQLGLEGSVVFTGYVSDADFPRAFAAADVLAINSPVETQSLIVLEAMATGIPVVGADAAAIPDAVADGENGFLFRPDDSTALADRLIMILTDDGLRARLKEGALNTAAEHSLERTTQKLLQVYDMAVAARARKSRSGAGFPRIRTMLSRRG